MWKSTIDEQELTFRLVGLNNQNFIMKDEQTGSWWQQVTGEAILGPLAGQRLERMPFEQLSWALWSSENPDTQVLESREEFAERYWNETEGEEDRDEEMFAFPNAADPNDPLAQGALLAAVRFETGPERAYPMALLREQAPINDRFEGRDLLVLLADDDRSVRCFDRNLAAAGPEPLEFYEKSEGEDDAATVWVDGTTGSEWDFSGRAISGPLAGSQLKKIQVYADYWFDWKQFNPEGRLYAAGL